MTNDAHRIAASQVADKYITVAGELVEGRKRKKKTAAESDRAARQREVGAMLRDVERGLTKESAPGLSGNEARLAFKRLKALITEDYRL